MSLIKRSVVLYKDSTKGVLTVIRLGETVGAKLMLNENPANGLWLGLKLGENKQQNFPITKQVTEFSPECDLCFNDSIGAILLDPGGTVYSYGGSREKVSVALIKESMEEAARESVAPISEKEEEAISAAAVPAEDAAIKEAPSAEIHEESAQIAPDAAPQPDSATPIPPTNESGFSAENEIDNNFWQPQESKTDDRKRGNPFNIPKAKNFYQAVRGRLEEIMTINPKEYDLEKLIPDSEWVKVRYENEDYYVVGRLFENNLVTYLGYGVPGIENVRPPKEAEELCDFLPLPGKKGAGYWLMFQKAEDGTISREIQ